MRTLANSEDPDEMLHDAAFHLCLHCLLRSKREIFFLEIIACNPSIYKLGHPKFIVPYQKEESIRVQRLKMCKY